MLQKIVLASVLFSMSLACPALFADQVTLKNGDRLTGEIVSSDGKTLTLKLSYAGTVAIQWDAVQEVSSGQSLYVRSKAGNVAVGPVSTSDGKLAVQTAESGAVSVRKDDVVSIRNKEQEDAAEAAVDRLSHPHLLDYWSGNVDTSLALARGNAETTTYNLGAKATRTTSRDVINVYATSLFASSRINTGCAAGTACVETTASAVRGGTRYDLNLSEKTFAFGQLDLEHDRFQDLDLRTVLSGGLGYHAVKNSRTTFDLMGGGSFDHEAFTAGLTRSEGEILTGEVLSFKASKSTTFTEGLQFFPNLTNTGEYRFTFDAGLVTILNKWLSWQTTYSNRFLSDPPPGIKKNDVLLTTGLRVNFGHPAK